MNRPVDTGSDESLSEAFGFAETVIEVGHSHPGVRRVLGAAGGTASFVVSLDDERCAVFAIGDHRLAKNEPL